MVEVRVVENRLFSEGLHVLGQPPGAQQMAQYLEAYFDGALSEDALAAVLESRQQGVEAVRSVHVNCLPLCSARCWTASVGSDAIVVSLWWRCIALSVY